MPGSTPSLSKFSQQEISKLFSTAKRCVRSKGLDILLAPTLQTSPQDPTLGLSSEKLPQDAALFHEPRGTGRILVITPRRIGNAPERNKIRRQFKALYQELSLAQRGYDCVIIVKPEGIDLAFDALKKLLLQAFENAPSAPKTNHDQ